MMKFWHSRMSSYSIWKPLQAFCQYYGDKIITKPQGTLADVLCCHKRPYVERWSLLSAWSRRAFFDEVEIVACEPFAPLPSWFVLLPLISVSFTMREGATLLRCPTYGLLSGCVPGAQELPRIQDGLYDIPSVASPPPLQTPLCPHRRFSPEV